jgi:phage gp36-like protein
MPYSTITSVSKKIDQRTLVQLLNDEVRPEVNSEEHDAVDLDDPTDPVVVRFEQAAAEAQAEIDPYLVGRYTLPFASIPTLIIAISDEITIYNCYKRRGNLPENVQNIYKNNVKMLEKISSGMMDLGIAEEPQNLSGEMRTNKTSSNRTFNDDMWEKY